LAKAAVMVVDGDVRILRMMQSLLEMEGYRVMVAGDGRTALKIFAEEPPDLVMLDVMLPETDGYALCRCIREFSQVPIIIVTSGDSEEDKVRGLDIGADDYVTKPFSARELTARVRAALRRAACPGNHNGSTFSCRGLLIDFTARRVSSRGKEVPLTSTEYKILSYMAQNADRVVIPDQILEHVWGDKYLGATHLLQVSVARLRRKLGDDARRPTYIMTRPGIGYVMMGEA